MMRRQKFCHLITAAQQQLAAEAETAAQRQRSPSPHHSSSRRHQVANGPSNAGHKAGQQLRDSTQQQEQHGHHSRVVMGTRNGPLSSIPAASTAGVGSTLELANTSHDL